MRAVRGQNDLQGRCAVATRAGYGSPIAAIFAANFDVRDIRLNEALPTARDLRRHLCDTGLTYDSRRKLLRSEGGTPAGFRLRYLGADDSQGPNYTGQAAVVSYYAS